MPSRSCLRQAAAAFILVAVQPALFAQWLGYPTAAVPRTPDGKPNISAPTPHTADGKPDFSGMWGWSTIGPPCGARCTDLQLGW